MTRKIIFAALISVSLNLFAHEGHDEAPGAIKTNHGGTVKAGKEINLEYVVSGSEVKLYPLSHEGKDLAATEVKLLVMAKSPKGKAETIKVDNKDGAYIAMVDFKGAYRTEVTVDADVKGKKSTFKFQVEK